MADKLTKVTEPTNWRKKLGAYHVGVHPLLVETADHIEQQEAALILLRVRLEDALNLLNDYARVYPNNSGRTVRFLDKLRREGVIKEKK